jgi:hypothetical protein
LPDIAWSDCTRCCEFDRIAQRQLENAYTELDLGGHRGERRQDLKRVERRPASAQRVSDPDTGKASGLDLPSKICDAIHQPVIGIGADPDHRADAHARDPPHRVTKS